MTYRSWRIEVLYGGQREPEEPSYQTKAPTLAVLPDRGIHCTLWRLTDWAKERGAPRRYVDNCWVRVEVSADELREFIRDVFAADKSTVHDIERRLSDAERYVIVAEEF